MTPGQTVLLHTAQPIRSTTQIWVEMYHQFGIFLHSFLRCHCTGKPVVALQSISCFLRLVDTISACLLQMVGIQIPRNEPTLLFRKSRRRRDLGVACLETHVRAESLFSPHSTFLFWYLAVAFQLHSNMFLFNLVETSKYLTSFHKPVKMARDLMFTSLLRQTLIQMLRS